MKDKEALQNRLKADIDQYEAMIDDELNRKKELLKKAAIIGGIVTAGLVVTTLMIKDEPKKTAEVNEFKGESKIGKLVLGIATPLLINFLKENLTNRS